MKLRKAIKLAAAAGTLVGMSAGAMADPTLGGFSTDGADKVYADCATGFTCASTPITDAGFLQRILTENSTGRKFIQNILTEGVTTDGGTTFSGTSGFADENFVEMGGTGGIISRQALYDNLDGETFKSTAVNYAGAFRAVNGTGITINQSVSENAGGMSTSFELVEFDDGNQGGNVSAQTTIKGHVGEAEFSGDFGFRTLVIEDTAGTYTSANYKKLDVDATLLGDVEQTVALRERTGAAVPDAGYMVINANGVTGPAWDANDTIVNLIIEQTTAGAGVFGLNDFANETQSTAQGIDSFSDANASGFQSATTTAADPFAAVTF